MQLIQQGLEFFFTDLFIGRRRDHRWGLRRWGFVGRGARRFVTRHTAVPAFTMQLIQQGLEFFFANFITVTRHCRDCHLGGFEQLIEGLIRRIRSDGLLWHRGNFRHSACGISFEQVFEIQQHTGLGMLRLLPAAQGVKLCVQHIQHRQHDIHQPRIDTQLIVTQGVENIFGTMAKAHHRIETEKTGAALDGVKATKHGIQQFLVIGALLKVDQLLVE